MYAATRRLPSDWFYGFHPFWEARRKPLLCRRPLFILASGQGRSSPPLRFPGRNRSTALELRLDFGGIRRVRNGSRAAARGRALSAKVAFRELVARTAFQIYRGVRRMDCDEIAAKRRKKPSAASRNQRNFTTDFSRVGGVRMAAPPLVEPDVRLFRIRLSCSLSPLAFTG